MRAGRAKFADTALFKPININFMLILVSSKTHIKNKRDGHTIEWGYKILACSVKKTGKTDMSNELDLYCHP